MYRKIISKRKRTQQSIQYDRIEKNKRKSISKAISKFKELTNKYMYVNDKAREEFPGEDRLSLKRRGSYVVRYLRKLKNKDISRFLKSTVGDMLVSPKSDGWRLRMLYLMRDVISKPGYGIDQALPTVIKLAAWGHEAIELDKAQKPIKEAVINSLMEYLPKNLYVDIGKDSQIIKYNEMFANEFDTMEVKIERMRNLVGKYNDVVKKVKKDLKSKDEMTRLSALVTSIIMETGIRPGKRGHNVIEVVDGEKIPVETFGAVSLGPQHIKNIRDDFAEIQFRGKKGALNIAKLEDPQVIKILKSYIEKANKEGSNYIFVTKNGEEYDYKHYQRYFREEVLSEFNASDFRKLKATQAVINSLVKRQGALEERIRERLKEDKTRAKYLIEDEIIKVIEEAYEEAYQELSHESVRTTIDSYVNPEILFRYLSQGYIEDSIEEALLKGKPILKFDVDKFIQKALKNA